MVKCIQECAIKMGLSILCLAPTGIAASNLPNGKTIHSAFNFSIKMKKDIFLADLSTDQLNRLRQFIDPTTIALVVIDEISYLSPELLAQIDIRLRQIMSTPEIPFGGISIAVMGDFFQLPPVKAKSLFSAVWKNFLEDTERARQKKKIALHQEEKKKKKS